MLKSSIPTWFLLLGTLAAIAAAPGRAFDYNQIDIVCIGPSARADCVSRRQAFGVESFRFNNGLRLSWAGCEYRSGGFDSAYVEVDVDDAARGVTLGTIKWRRGEVREFLGNRLRLDGIGGTPNNCSSGHFAVER